ncbi:hypothetical protein FRB99_001246 [Tulasnella sp. 403]|nr:hypothetical protein FRB99_001246 [Tulasnella sp. 403]
MNPSSWVAGIRAAVSPCLCGSTARPDSPDIDEQQQSGRHIFSRDELEGLLASASSDEDADVMSLHSNIGQRTKRSKRNKKGKKHDAWGMLGRNFSTSRRRSMLMFGWHPFGKPTGQITLSDDDEAPGPSRRRHNRALSTTTDSDASPLDSSAIAQLVSSDDRDQTSTTPMNSFQPDQTDEDLIQEERQLAEREEAQAPPEFSFPVEEPVLSAPSLTTAPTSELVPEQTETGTVLGLALSSATSMSPQSSIPAPLTPTSPSFSPPPDLKLTHPHSARIREAAREQRRRIREEAKRIAREEIERRAEAAAGGFNGEENLEFGEYVGPIPVTDGVAWTETSEGTSYHPPAPLPAQPQVQQPTPKSDDDADSLLDYGAEYAHRPKRKSPRSGASGSDRTRSVARNDTAEVQSVGSSTGSTSRHRSRGPKSATAFPLPPSTVGSAEVQLPPHPPIALAHGRSNSTPVHNLPSPSKKMKGAKTHRSQGSMSSKSGSVHNGRNVVSLVSHLPQVADPTFDGVPGGLDELHDVGLQEGARPDALPLSDTPTEQFDGVPGGLDSLHTATLEHPEVLAHVIPRRSRQNTIDATHFSPEKRRTGVDSVATKFPSTGFSTGRPRRATTTEGLLNGAALARREDDI